MIQAKKTYIIVMVAGSFLFVVVCTASETFAGESVNNSDIATILTTIAGFIITWVATLIGIGKIYGMFTQKLEQHDAELTTINKRLVSDDGEPLVMTLKSYDIASGHCQDRMNDRYKYVIERQDKIDTYLTRHDDKLDKILETISKLEERGSSARTRADD